MEKDNTAGLMEVFKLLSDYDEKKISDDEAFQRLHEMNILPEYDLKDKVVLKDLSAIIHILNSLEIPEPDTLSIDDFLFEESLKESVAWYFDYLIIKGQTIDEFSFTQFTEMLLEENKYSREEFKKIEDVSEFWEHIKKIETFINTKVQFG